MAQTKKGYSPVKQFFVNHGYVLLAPNVRGSTGYGKTYHQLDDHDWGGALLFVIQSANDPRVKPAESDQIVQAIKKRGGLVEYMLFEDEGHGLRKIPNQIRAYKAVKRFLDEHVIMN